MHVTIKKSVLAAVAAAAALILLAGGIAVATIPSSSGAVDACYNKGNGALRVIDAEAGQQCNASETSLRIAAADATGKVANADLLDGLDGAAYLLSCPAGTELYLGLCFERHPRTADNHGDASRACSADGKRLPSEGEMRSYRDQPGNDIARFEWTDELSDTDVESTFLYAVVGTFGSAVSAATNERPFRCVSGPTG